MPDFLKILTQSDTPTQLTDSRLPFNTATFWGHAGFNVTGIPLANSANIYLGISSGRMTSYVASASFLSWDVGTKGGRKFI